MRSILLLLALVGCVSTTPYQQATIDWTRKAKLRTAYQESLQLAATYKSLAWRLAHAEREADARGLGGNARTERLAQARAEAAGPIEIQLLVTTWERRENDLDRGERSVWRVRLIDGAGVEIAPLEIVKDRRPRLTIRSEFPAMGDFATAYVARFPPQPALDRIRLRMSSPRGGVELEWPARAGD
jgi:hypothetical protein